VSNRERPATRARAIAVFVGIAAIVGATLIRVADRFEPALRAWLIEDPRGRSRIVLAMLAALTAGPALAAAGYCWRVGGSRRRVLRVVAIVLAVASVLLVFVLWRFFVLLEGGVQ
jgi:hypothetical protein